jgi:cytidine deaminase
MKESGMALEALGLEERERLIAMATAVAGHAYAPYSKLYVGAALLLESGETVVGCNVENCSYRLTSCAEQGAIARAVAEYGAGIRLRAVAVANLNGAISMPCGACRQTLAEFGGDETVLFYPGEGGEILETTLGELLPAAFRAEFLT